MKKETMEHEISQPRERATSSGTVNLPAARKPDSQESPGDDDGGILDQVRDLLFGDQARETDQLLQAIETRLATSIAQMRMETLDRIETLSREMREQLDKIEERLTARETEWNNANQTLSQRIEDIRSELSQQLIRETKDLAERITDGQQKTIAYVDHAAGTLEKAKADRDALARLFSQMASQIEAEESGIEERSD